jgi:hypothetical protein
LRIVCDLEIDEIDKWISLALARKAGEKRFSSLVKETTRGYSSGFFCL